MKIHANKQLLFENNFHNKTFVVKSPFPAIFSYFFYEIRSNYRTAVSCATFTLERWLSTGLIRWESLPVGGSLPSCAIKHLNIVQKLKQQDTVIPKFFLKQIHCNTENLLKQIFPKKEFLGHQSQYPHSCVCERLYIPTIDLFILLQEICGLILGIYKSLTDTWMWKLWLRLHNSQKQFPEKEYINGIFVAVQSNAFSV
jgi:hypothetical protein